MARSRQIKPDFFLNEELAARGPMAQLLFAGLWTLADREGRLKDEPGKIKAQVFPYYEADVNSLLETLSEGFVRRYSVGDGRFIEILNFKKHQHIHPDEKSSIFPANPKKPGNPLKSPGISKEARKLCPLAPSPSSFPSPSSVAASPLDAEIVASKPDRTPIQKVMRGYKEAKGIDADDAAWDKLHFKRFARAAKDLLRIFKGDPMAAILYTLKKGEEWDEKLPGWGLEGVARAAATDPIVMGLTGEKDEHENGALASDRSDGKGRNRRLTSSGELAGDALRGLKQASVRGPGDGNVGGDEPHLLSDGETFS